MSALMGVLFVWAMCYGVFGWLGEKYSQWKWNRAHR